MATDEKPQTSSCELEMGYQTTVVSYYTLDFNVTIEVLEYLFDSLMG